MSVGALPKQLGYMLLQDGTIAKSEGDLVNAERLASVVLRMVAVGSFFASPVAAANAPVASTNACGDESNEVLSMMRKENTNPFVVNLFCSPYPHNQFDRLTVLFSDHQYDILVGNGGGPLSVTGGRQSSQQQKQIIHVVKRALSSSDSTNE